MLSCYYNIILQVYSNSISINYQKAIIVRFSNFDSNYKLAPTEWEIVGTVPLNLIVPDI